MMNPVHRLQLVYSAKSPTPTDALDPFANAMLHWSRIVPVAQRTERRPSKPRVVGSNPSRDASLLFTVGHALHCLTL